MITEVHHPGNEQLLRVVEIINSIKSQCVMGGSNETIIVSILRK